MLIIAKRAGLCLLINKQTIPPTEQLSFENCWPHAAPKTELSRGRPRSRPGWTVGSHSWLLWSGCWFGKRHIPISFKWRDSEYSFPQENCRTLAAMPGKGCSYIICKRFSQESPFWPGKELHLSVVLFHNLKRELLKGVTDKKKRMGLEKAQCGSQALTLCRGWCLQDCLCTSIC